MVGGTVIEIIVLEDKVWLNCQEDGKPYLWNYQCAIYVERNEDSEEIRTGDKIWWQGEVALWTTKNRTVPGEKVAVDLHIPRCGFSGVPRPRGVKVIRHDAIEMAIAT